MRNKRVIEISKNVFQVGSRTASCFMDCRSYVVRGPEGTVMIDCGSPQGLGNLLRNMDEVDIELDDVKTLFATHCHFDHFAAAAEIKRKNPDTYIAAHRDEAEAIENADQEMTCAGWMFGEDLEPVTVDNRLDDGEVVESAGLTFEIISTPGHSPGSITIITEVDNRRIAFTGDNIVHSCDRVGYNREALVETLEMLADMRVDHVCPGHEMMEWATPELLAMRGVPGAMEAGVVLRKNIFLNPVSAVAQFIYEYNAPVVKLRKYIYRN